VTGARTGYAMPETARFNVLGADNFSQTAALSFGNKLAGPSCASTDFSAFSKNTTIDLTHCSLIDGAYKLTVRSRDEAGNVEESPSTRDFMVDSKAPSVEIMQTPPARSTELAADFVVIGQDFNNVTAAKDLHYMFRVRGLFEEFSAPVADPSIAVDGLPSGDYTFEVTAIDLAGNHSPIKGYAFSVDNLAPVTSVGTKVPNWTTAESITIDATGSDDRTDSLSLEYLVTLDNAQITRMRAPLSLPNITEGRHSVRVAAIDDFGNVDPTGVLMAFNVDRTAPETALDRTPTKFGTGTFRPTLTGTDNLTAQDELRYSYRVTRGSNTSEWSEPALAGDVAIMLKENGPVKIEIAAVDNAGLIDATPVELSGIVKAASGCSCSSQETTGEDLMSFAALAGLVLLLRRRRKA